MTLLRPTQARTPGAPRPPKRAQDLSWPQQAGRSGSDAPEQSAFLRLLSACLRGRVSGLQSPAQEGCSTNSRCREPHGAPFSALTMQTVRKQREAESTVRNGTAQGPRPTGGGTEREHSASSGVTSETHGGGREAAGGRDADREPTSERLGKGPGGGGAHCASGEAPPTNQGTTPFPKQERALTGTKEQQHVCPAPKLWGTLSARGHFFLERG